MPAVRCNLIRLVMIRLKILYSVVEVRIRNTRNILPMDFYVCSVFIAFIKVPRVFFFMNCRTGITIGCSYIRTLYNVKFEGL